MQGLEDEKEQFKLNAVCKHIKDQMHQYQAMFVYHQMLFDIGESQETFIRLFNNQLKLNQYKCVQMSVFHQNTIFAA